MALLGRQSSLASYEAHHESRDLLPSAHPATAKSGTWRSNLEDGQEGVVVDVEHAHGLDLLHERSALYKMTPTTHDYQLESIQTSPRTSDDYYTPSYLAQTSCDSEPTTPPPLSVRCCINSYIYISILLIVILLRQYQTVTIQNNNNNTFDSGHLSIVY